MGKIIGIDLGTSNSAAAVMVDGKPTIIQAAEGTSVGGKAFPSVVAFTREGQLIVGEPARRQMISNPEGTVLAAKRKMGTDYRFTVFGKDFHKEYTPQQISSFILQKIKRDAEAFLLETVDKAVITVPASFNENQRQATKDAGEIAGLQVVRIINEPTAASLAYGLDKVQKDLKIMVFDFGGGMLNVIIMEMGGGVFQVKSTSGDTQLGGTDMDNALVDYVVQEFKQQSGLDLRNDKAAMMRIREAAEKAKIELSNIVTTEINLRFISYDPARGPLDLILTITRAKLEELLRPIVERCRSPIMQAIQDTRITPAEIDKIILIGGPTRMPIVRQFVANVMGKEPERGVDPMESVAMGAAIQGAIISGDVSTDIFLIDVTPLTLGIEVLDHNTLGVGIQGGLKEPLIVRNTTTPSKKSKVFTTAADYQTAVTIHVVQGERPMAADCLSLGMFNLSGIPPAPRGIPQIEVTFDIDANGILNVTAKDLATSKEEKITVTAMTKLSEYAIKSFKEELKHFATVDEIKKEQYDVKNEADNLIYAAEKLVKQDLVSYIQKKPEQANRVNKSSQELKDAIAGSNIDDIKAKMQELKNILGEVSAEAYRWPGRAYETVETPPEIEAESFNGGIISEETQSRLDDKLKKYYGKSHAIIIGISKYKEERSLANAYNDAMGVKKILESKYGFDDIQSFFNENATGDGIRYIFDDLIQDEQIIGPKDRILVYYSGHGKMKTRLGYEGQQIKEGYIVPYDSKLKRYSSNISMETIVKGCQDCPAKHVLLILDCCYSGYAAIRTSEPAKPRKASDRERYLKDISSRRAIQVIAAGQEDEPVSDSGISPGYSAFTGALLDILEAELDLDNDGILTASEIGSNLEKLVASHSINQRPMYSPIAGARGGDFIFKLFHINNP